MKKNFKYALMSAIAFAGSVSFSACSSSDEVIDNPNYDPETNSVKAQFAISLGDNVVKTRMSSENTQASGTVSNFRGIQDIFLIPFKSGSAADANLNGKVIALGNFDQESSTTGSEKNYLYYNVDVKTGTNYFYLYAVAQPGGKTNAQVGCLTPNLPAADATSVTLDNIKFTPVSIMNSAESGAKTQAENVSKNLVAKLNQVKNATGWSTSDNVSLLQALDKLKALCVGSSEGVQKALQDLYTNVSAISGDETTNTVVNAIKTAFTTAPTTVYGENVTITASTSGTLTFGEGYNGYPGSIGLPNGAARLTYDETNGFKSVDSDILWATTNTTPLVKFVYPADLRYFVQTNIKTAASEYLTTNLNNSWSSITSNSSVYSNNIVDGNTRSIILTNPVKYGVGRLEANIAAMNATDGKYYDRDHNEVTIPEDGFTLTGVVIGGQKAVNSTFVPTGSDIYTIYDSDVSDVKTSTTVASVTNHTLVLETAAEAKIRVALQFTNNSTKAFKGADGIIYPNQTFYLVAELDPKATTGVNQPSSATETITQVFKQDYVTKVTFGIKPGSSSGTTPNSDGFGSALSGLPDLTTSRLEFGLSVDLSWKPGLTFTVNI